MTHEQIEQIPAYELQARTENGRDNRPLRAIARSFADSLPNERIRDRYYREIDRFLHWVEVRGFDLEKIGLNQVEAWVTFQRSAHWSGHAGDCTTDCKQLKKQPYATRTIKRRVAIVSGFYDYAVKHSRLPSNPARKAVKFEKVHPDLDTLTPTELQQLFDAARRTHPHLLPNRIAINLRNACLIALIGGAGLRREEAVTLRIENVKTDDAGRPTISFTRKGNVPAKIEVSLPVYRAILDAAGDRTEGPVLLSESRRRGKSGDHLALSAVDRIITELGTRTGIRGSALYAHLFRKTAITLALTLPETTPERVMNYFGHTNFITTSGYDAFRKMTFKDIAVNPLQTQSFWLGEDLARYALAA